ncbi:MAG TPA: hypothetical protein VIT45_07320 [Allosphingosinicella sp.]
MAFTQVGSWDLAHSRAAAPSWAPGVQTRRGAAIIFSILVHLGLLWMLLNHLAGAMPLREKEEALRVFNVLPPGIANEDSGAKPRPELAALAAPSVPEVDLSTPADLPKPEWTMAKIRVPRAALASEAVSGESAQGDSSGRGSPPRLNQFVGFGDGAGGELLLDKVMLESARLAAIRAFPESKGTALVFLRVSSSGKVMNAVIKGGSSAVGSALRRELVGKQLFQVRSKIAESALVALPPVSLAI